MKNKGLIITLIVILSIFTLGIIFLFVTLMNNKINFSKINLGYKVSNELILNETYENDFTNINISSTMGDIYIKNSRDNKVKVEIYGNKQDLSKKITNDSLAITYKDKGCFGICLHKEAAKIIIYLPAEYSNILNIKNDYGDINVGNFKKAKVVIDEDCGDVEIDKVNELELSNNYGDTVINKVTKANIDEDCGNIKISEVSDLTINSSYGDTKIDNITNSVKLKGDCGDININNLTINKNSFIENSFGDIKIKQTNDVYIEAKVDMGDKKINNNNRKSEVILKVNNDCGDVKVNY